jgi:hypothetical protein
MGVGKEKVKVCSNKLKEAASFETASFNRFFMLVDYFNIYSIHAFFSLFNIEFNLIIFMNFMD